MSKRRDLHEHPLLAKKMYIKGANMERRRKQDDQGEHIHLPYCGIETSIPVLLTNLEEVFGFSAKQILKVQTCLASCNSWLVLKILECLAEIVVEDCSLCIGTGDPL